MEHLAFWIPVSLAALLVYAKLDRAMEDLRYVSAMLRGRRPAEPTTERGFASVDAVRGAAHAEPYLAWTASAAPADLVAAALADRTSAHPRDLSQDG
jgi:hypothetical protein